MRKTVKIKGDIVSIEMEDTLTEMTLALLKTANPLGAKVFRETIAEIRTKAKQQWPVRQPTKIIRDDNGEPKRTKDGKVRFRRQKSKGSIDKFITFARVNGPVIEVGMENRAEYAWAIRMGMETKGQGGRAIIIPLRARVANELMVKPLRRKSKDVITVYTRGLLKAQSEV